MLTTTKYIWDEQNLLAEADGSDAINVIYTNAGAPAQQYGDLASTRNGSTTSYHHFDALGSTRQLTNSAQTVTDTAIYDAWGNVVSRSGTTAVRLLWIAIVGYYFDPETGLLYIRERIYGPLTGRWLSEDPAGYVDGPNQYLYVKNRPTTLVDPSGMQCKVERPTIYDEDYEKNFPGCSAICTGITDPKLKTGWGRVICYCVEKADSGMKPKIDCIQCPCVFGLGTAGNIPPEACMSISNCIMKHEKKHMGAAPCEKKVGTTRLGMSNNADRIKEECSHVDDDIKCLKDAETDSKAPKECKAAATELIKLKQKYKDENCNKKR